jgi:hypothetical protein
VGKVSRQAQQPVAAARAPGVRLPWKVGVEVDLAGVTFMGSNLVGFLVQVGNAVSDARRHLVLCRPTPIARTVIHVAGLELFASVHPNLPAFWPVALVDPATSLSA